MSVRVNLRGDEAWKVVGSRDFKVWPMASSYRGLSAATGLDFSAVIGAFDTHPLFLDGADHKAARVNAAMFLSTNRRAHEAVVDGVVDDVVAEIDNRQGDFDLLTELGDVMFDALAQSYCGVRDDLIPLSLSLQGLFLPKAPLRVRKATNDRMQAIIDKDGKEALDQIILAVVGLRALSGGLVLSLHRIVTENYGKRLCDIVFPETFSESVLRFADRMHAEPVVVSGCPYAAQTVFRCVTFDADYKPEENAKNLFGAGAHLCLGRPVSQYVWDRMVARLSLSQKRIKAGEIVVNDYEFYIAPAVCVVSVSDI
jgi:hypothetical protein